MGKASKGFKIACIIVAVLGMNWIFTRPNIYAPGSPYSAWDEGFKLGYGEYPKTCDSWNCLVHHRGFWCEVFNIGVPPKAPEPECYRCDELKALEEGNAKLRAYKQQLIDEIAQIRAAQEKESKK